MDVQSKARVQNFIVGFAVWKVAFAPAAELEEAFLGLVASQADSS